MSRLWFASVFALAAPAVAAPRPVTERWAVDWGKEYCSVARQTGGSRPVTLALRTIPGSRLAELWLTGPDWDSGSVAKAAEIRVQLAPGGYTLTQPTQAAKLETGHALVVYQLDAEFVSRFGEATSIVAERAVRSSFKCRSRLRNARSPGCDNARKRSSGNGASTHNPIFRSELRRCRWPIWHPT